jgi:hypothetical protein
MDLLIPVVITTSASTFFTEVLKFFPIFGKTDLRKKILAAIVSVLATVLYIFRSPEFAGYDFVLLFLLTLFFSYLTFKTIVQPAEVKVIELKANF